MSSIKKQAGFILFGMVALLTAIAFASADSRANVRRKDIISCGVDASTSMGYLLYRETENKDNKNDHQPMNNKQPVEKNDGNACSHQLAGSTACNINGQKRRLLKTPTC